MTGPSARDEEQGLVAAAIRGEEAAWRRIVLRYGRAISAKISQVYLRRTGRNATEIEAQEIAQEVMVRVARNRARSLRNFRWKCGLATYLSAVAGTCALDRIRADAGRRAREKGRLALEEVEESKPLAAEGPPELMLAAESIDALRRALEGLPERDRLVLRMYYWEGMPPSAIARGLGTSADYVWVLLKRIHGKIRQEMKIP